MPDFDEYRVLAGSYMYGTNVETSDKDYRGFYIPTKEQLYGFRAPADTVTITEGGKDEAYWPIQKYFSMCSQANPNVIETIFAPIDCVVGAGYVGWRVRDMAHMFLSKKIATSYLGYATGNYHRTVKNRDPANPYDYDGKDVMHLIRLVRMGNETLRTGKLRVRREEDRNYFLRIRKNQEPWWAIETEFLAHKENWSKIEASSSLPEEPDFDRLNKILVRLVEDHFLVYEKENR